jgi:hypothetical protein
VNKRNVRRRARFSPRPGWSNHASSKEPKIATLPFQDAVLQSPLLLIIRYNEAQLIEIQQSADGNAFA